MPKTKKEVLGLLKQIATEDAFTKEHFEDFINLNEMAKPNNLSFEDWKVANMVRLVVAYLESKTLSDLTREELTQAVINISKTFSFDSDNQTFQSFEAAIRLFIDSFLGFNNKQKENYQAHL